jgi:uncharacterized protein YndB with AHSA1/START domain
MDISVEVTLQAQVAQVWEAYVSPDDIQIWNAASDDWHTTKAFVDLREGGKFSSRMEAKDGSEGFDFEGVYTKIIEEELIEYSFGNRMARVTFENTSDGVKVTVSFDAEDINSAELQRAGWQAILDNFAKYVLSKKV